MTGNIPLNVAIGLVFIYTLYSLLTTTIVEFVATLARLRSIHLWFMLKRMLDGDHENVFANDFFHTPVIKYLSRMRISFRSAGKSSAKKAAPEDTETAKGNSQFGDILKFPAYIKAETFSQALIYVLKSGKNNNQSMINQLKETLREKQNTDIGKYLQFLLDNANDDIEKFTLSIETWFDANMERLKDWYKRNITFFTFVLAFLMAMLFNIDTIKMTDKLSTDPKAREQFVQLASQLLNNPDFAYLVNASGDETGSSAMPGEVNGMNSASVNPDILAELEDSILAHNRQVLIERMDTLYSMATTSQNIFRFKRNNRITWFFDSWVNFLGCLLTTIALSLGAPFWFDLLNKLMKLRGSIAIPTIAESEDKKATKPGISKTAVG